MTLDNELKNALRRVPAPDGLADRVMARLGQAEPAPKRAPWWRAVAAAFILAAILGSWGARQMYERRQEEEGERARDQVLLALRITASKVAGAQREVSRQISH